MGSMLGESDGFSLGLADSVVGGFEGADDGSALRVGPPDGISDGALLTDGCIDGIEEGTTERLGVILGTSLG